MCRVRKLIEQGNFVDGEEYEYRRKNKDGIISNDWRASKEKWKMNKSSCFFNNDYVFYMSNDDDSDYSAEFGTQKNPSPFDGDFNDFISDEYDFEYDY